MLMINVKWKKQTILNLYVWAVYVWTRPTAKM